MTLVAVSGARNRTHVLYVNAYLSGLQSRPAESVAQVVNAAHVDSSSFDGSNGYDRIEVIDLDSTDFFPAPLYSNASWAQSAVDPLVESPQFDEYVAVGRLGIGPILAMLRSCRRLPNKLVVVDEGLGGYGSAATNFAAVRREGGSCIAAAKRFVACETAALIPHLDWKLYSCEGRNWFVVDEVAQRFRQTIGDLVADSRLSTSFDVVVLTQPWPELGLVSAAEHVRSLDQIVSTIRSAGLTVAVRPHPQENLHRYRDVADVIRSKGGPAESDPAVRSARAVVGETSSALVNLSALFGLSGVRVAWESAVSTRLPLSRRQRSLLDSFVATSSSSRDLVQLVSDR